MGRAARPVRERRRADADAQGEARGGDEELRRGDRRDVRVAGEVRALRPERCWRRLDPGGADELLMAATSARTADDARRTAGHVASRVSGGKTSTMHHTV